MTPLPPDSPNRAEAIFHGALDIPGTRERAEYLDAACAGDAALRAEVEDLLRAEESRDFLNGPAVAGAGATAILPAVEKSGERIGRYRLLQQIGEGGFGTVWMAEQMEPVTRRVALKIIKAGMDTKEVIARFEAERQALAMMDHPNIAKVLDAGATDKGRPFFVMELVKGIPITRFCDEREFTTRQRLELFADVCSAINHAHQKGVIHRDIKPSNVMVTISGDRPVVKVIDFGIAKATQGKLTDRTLFTRFEQFLGTPAYMSPEQAAIADMDIDTRSDIYALGVLLYELLTGKPPFDAKTLLSAGYEEMRRIIREVEPPKPSTRLNTLSQTERTALAKARHIEPEKLRRLVEPDIDWIVMKAIEKDRARRYETANGLALDIQRFLADEPVSAGPPTAAYRFHKFARRHKFALRVAVLAAGVLVIAAVISTALIAAVLVAATIVSTWQAARATLAGKRAAKAERTATAKAAEENLAREDAEVVSNFLIDVFQSADPARDGPTITVVQTLDRAAEKLATDSAIQPGRRAKLHCSLGKTYHALGLYGQAISQLEKARDYFGYAVSRKQREQLNVMRDIGLAHYEAGREVEARKLWEEILNSYVHSLGPEDSDTLWTRTYLAHVYDKAGRRDEALIMREEILQLRRKSGGPEHADTLFSMHELAISYFHGVGDWTKALKMQEDVIARRRKVLGPEHPDTLQSLENLAVYLYWTGGLADALKVREEVLALRTKVNGPTHPDTLSAVANLADSYIAAGRFEHAIALLANSISHSPDFLSGALKLSALHAWLGKETPDFMTAQFGLHLATETTDPTAADQAAKAYSLRHSLDTNVLKISVTLSRRAVELGQGHPWLPWYQVGLGMAEYRLGNYSAADYALTSAKRPLLPTATARTHREQKHVCSAFEATACHYHAMSLFRQGKESESIKLFNAAETQMKPLPVDGRQFSEAADHNDLICWLAYKEAKALIFPEQ